jgi:hypothetical protein
MLLYGNTSHDNENAMIGQFAITTAETRNYIACLWIDSAEKRSGMSMGFNYNIGVATKEWEMLLQRRKKNQFGL